MGVSNKLRNSLQRRWEKHWNSCDLSVCEYKFLVVWEYLHVCYHRDKNVCIVISYHSLHHVGLVVPQGFNSVENIYNILLLDHLIDATDGTESSRTSTTSSVKEEEQRSRTKKWREKGRQRLFSIKHHHHFGNIAGGQENHSEVKKKAGWNEMKERYRCRENIRKVLWGILLTAYPGQSLDNVLKLYGP